MEKSLNSRSRAQKGATGVLIALFAVVLVLVSIFPLLFSFLSSFKQTAEIYGAPFAMPKAFALENYAFAFESTNILRGMLNSLLYAVASVAVIIVMSLCIGFAIRLNVPFKNGVFLFFIAGMTLPVHATLIPLASIINALHLKDTALGLIGIYIATNLSLAVFLITGYMKGISREMDESALLDGCGPLRLLFQIIAPLTMPAVSTVAIMSFLRVYNDLIFSVLLINKKSMATISVALMAFQSQYDVNYGGTFAGICISIIPMIAIYIVFQKRIEAGLTAGAVKG